MTSITVTTTLTRDDLWWNQIYWWYRNFFIRFLGFSIFGVLAFIIFSYSEKNLALIFAFLCSFIAFLTSYIVDLIFFFKKNIWISKQHKKLLSKIYTTCFSEENYTSTYEDGAHTEPYNHYEKVYLYKKHIILKPVGMGDYFHMIKWQDVPENQRQELKDLLSAKILKAPKA